MYVYVCTLKSLYIRNRTVSASLNRPDGKRARLHLLARKSFIHVSFDFTSLYIYTLVVYDKYTRLTRQ